MNSQAQADLQGAVQQFNGLVNSGNPSASNEETALDNLNSLVSDDLSSYTGLNTAGLNATSFKALAGMQNQLDQLQGAVGLPGMTTAPLQSFGQQIQQTLTPTQPQSQVASDPTSIGTGAAIGSGSTGMVAELMHLMEQVLHQMQGGSGQASQAGSGAAAGTSAGIGSGASSGSQSPTDDLSADSGISSLKHRGMGSILSELLTVLQQLTGQMGSGGANAASSPSTQSGGLASSESGTAGPASSRIGPLLQELVPVFRQAVGSQTALARSDAATSGPELSGNLNKDVQTLLQMVSGVGTDGTKLAAFAKEVAQEAKGQDNALVGNVASNIAGSLSDGTYDQQGSVSALGAAEQGKSVDPLQNNIANIITQLQSGESSGSVSNNLNALSKEASNGGDTSLASLASQLATGVQNGSISDSSAASQLQAAATGNTTPVTSAPNSAETAQLEQMMMELMQMMQQMLQMMQGGNAGLVA